MSQTKKYQLSNVEVNLLEEIREHAKKARSLPRIDIFKACDLVQIDFELITPEILSILIKSSVKPLHQEQCKSLVSHF